MGDAGAHFQQNGGVVLLGELIRELCEAERFLRVGRLEHGDLSRDRIVAAVLLILRAVHAGIVRNADDHTGVDARVGHGEQRVGGDVQSDMLHTAGGALASESRAECGFHCDLFIGRPFAVDVVILCEFLGDLRAGCARIAGDDRAACFVQSAGNRFVSYHEFFHNYFTFGNIRIVICRGGSVIDYAYQRCALLCPGNAQGSWAGRG